ncbi:ATP-binding protein [Aquabacterium sp. A7-Y]|uniref:hybrid sensor histidine kinase/response regulator n=1 Tax=Aquabacterium sp. A7-Y TaxID=1349605 RepID=UPI00223E1987|nr:ATP-binding protein [Aquabacterium sp. A7-Y]MCW7536693.1 ATP-binding protein [Aquabacterium sp. A7-Y]
MTNPPFRTSAAEATELSLLRDLCENATVSLFVMDDRQHCAYMNRSAEVLTGYSLEEVQGAPLHQFIHHHYPDGRPYPLDQCPIDRAAPAGMQERGEEVFIHKDGSFFPVSFTASPIRRDGRVIGTVIEVQDARPRLRQDEERDAMRQIGLLILQELKAEKIVQAVTDTATQLTGAQFGAFFYNVIDDKGESYTLYCLSGVPREKFDRFPLPRATRLFGPTFRGEGTIRCADVQEDPRYGQMSPHYGMPAGHLPVRSYLAVPVKLGSGEVVGGLFFGHASAGVFTEVHERLVESLAAQAAIGLNKAKLFQEADQARRRAEREAEEKYRLYHEAAEANRLKDQFLATVSHELRTPLTSILGWTKMLSMGTLDAEMTRRAISTIDRNARAQAQIVEDLLDISRIVSGKLRLNVQLCAPAQSVEAAVEAMRPAALAKDIRLQLLVDPLAGPVSGDPERLQQVVWNLVSNAVKFTPKRGRVQVTVERVNSHIEITVRDSGAGIAAEHLPHIFERFTQVDSSSTRQHGGLGLGLAIVRQLVEMHGGTVHVASDGPGKGAAFTVCLPLAPITTKSTGDVSVARVHPTTGTTGADTELARFGLGGCTVLLVEDDEDARHMLSAVLESGGATVELASSAEQGLTLAEGLQPDVVISDIGMPDRDGYAFIKALRALERERGRTSAPAIALTAFARVEDRLRALEEGFQMHVPKPVEPAELLAVVSSLRSWKAQLA